MEAMQKRYELSYDPNPKPRLIFNPDPTLKSSGAYINKVMLDGLVTLDSVLVGQNGQ